MRKNDKGFGVVGILAVLSVVAVLSLITWYFISNKDKATNTDTPNSSVIDSGKKQTKEAKQKPFDTTKEFVDSSTNVSFRYPETWKLTNEGDPSGVGYLTNITLQSDSSNPKAIFSLTVRSMNAADQKISASGPEKHNLTTSEVYIEKITVNGSDYALIGRQEEINGSNSMHLVNLAKCDTVNSCYDYLQKNEGSITIGIQNVQGHGAPVDMTSGEYEQMKDVIKSLKF